MSYQPIFSINMSLLTKVESMASLRSLIQSSAVQVSWIPALQKDSRTRNTHSSTAIEGNPLTLAEVRALEEGAFVDTQARSKREVLNYFAALRHVEKQSQSKKKRLVHEDIFRLHAIIAGKVMDQGEAGRYRTMRVRVGSYLPPPPNEVSGLMFELLEWWNKDALLLSPVLSSAILHYRFEAIHPFADGNGRAGRALALWELYRRGFDSHHIFAVDEFYWEDRARYYAALEEVRSSGEDLTHWLEYSAEGLQQTLERTWERMGELAASTRSEHRVLRPRQEQLLKLLGQRGGMAPAELWKALKISKQGAMDLLRPLLDAGLVKRIGTSKNGRYVLK
jgi:Fic family protein